MTNTINTQAIIGECYDCGERAVLQSFEYEDEPVRWDCPSCLNTLMGGDDGTLAVLTSRAAKEIRGRQGGTR